MPPKSGIHLSVRFAKYPCLVFILILLPAFLNPVHAKSITSDGTMGTNVSDGPDYTISQGTIQGGNQFHSFEKFNVNFNESATFIGPNSIQNIIGRVTGVDQSFIDGLLRSSITDANLFLMNPRGVIFGPNASLDVSGAFHVTTADYIRLGENGVFYANPLETDVLTADPPSAFGFLGSNPAGIDIDRSWLEMPDSLTISLVGGDINIYGDPAVAAVGPQVGRIQARGGRINLIGVASSGEVGLNAQQEIVPFALDSFENLGNIAITDTGFVSTTGPGGGSIMIRGGRFLLANDSHMYASTALPAVGGNNGQGIDIEVRNDAIIRGSQMGSNVFAGVTDDSGGIRIKADRIDVVPEITPGGLIQPLVTSIAFSGSTGNNGDIDLTSNSLLVEFGTIQTAMAGNGEPGDINIYSHTGDVELRNAGWLYSPTAGGTSDGGDINIWADNLSLSNAYHPWGYITAIQTRTYNPAIGKAGDITIIANNISMGPGTEISTPTFGWGGVFGSHRGGDIDITAHESLTIEGTDILTSNGDIIYSGIFANSFGTGQGGSIIVNAGEIDMTNEASMQASAFWTGNAGSIEVNADNFELRDASFLTSTGLFGFGGSSGSVTVNADTMLISGKANTTDPFQSDFTGISTAAGYNGGDGGNISLNLDESLYMTQRALITSTSYGPGRGGDIIIDSPQFKAFDGSRLTSSSFGTGDGGNIQIDTDYLVLSGVNPELVINSVTGETNMSPTFISSQSGFSGGNAGDIRINAYQMNILDGATIAANSYGPGDSGSIVLSGEIITISGKNAAREAYLASQDASLLAARSSVLTTTESLFLGDAATGNGGNITIDATKLYVRDEGLISSGTTGPGVGGNIIIDTERTTLENEARITAVSSVSPNAGKAGDISIIASDKFTNINSIVSSAARDAQGGNVSIEANNIMLDDNAFVSARSFGQGDAGNIILTADDTLWMQNNSHVTTEAVLADGGNIKINAQYMVSLWDSEITASVGGGPSTTGGNINIDPEFVVLNNSQIIANAFEGAGGNIEITTDQFVADHYSTVSASSKYGLDGSVDIQTGTQPVSEGLTPLPQKFQSAVALLREPCLARMSAGQHGSLIIKERESIPFEPGGLLPVPITVH